MKKLNDVLAEELESAFESAGFDRSYAKVTVSNRPDLCEYQCNGAMAAAKQYRMAPLQIAEQVVDRLHDSAVVTDVTAVRPGFINFRMNPEWLADFLNRLAQEEKLGVEQPERPQTIMIDYGGPNVAKPLHIGHLRSAIIGESIKRIGRFMGHRVIGDVHLGDWGLQIGLLIAELRLHQPELIYFDETYTGEYPENPPFTIGELEQLYPQASARSKEDEAFYAQALEATHLLQEGRRGYRALWQHIIHVSVEDIKKNYDRLNVSFDLWKKESDVQPYIPDMLAAMERQGIAREDDGALIVDVAEDDDAREIPPCIVRKSDGAALYTTTDLATLVEREREYHPDRIIYVADKRQELHFIQVFRTARKAGIVSEHTELEHIAFGTMNGKDGRPFKTRTGGVMRLETLLAEVNEEMEKKINEGRTMSQEEVESTAKLVALSAVKYGDLSNQASKDYVFDVDRFTSFEGNTGPYILYTIVRMKSILSKYQEQWGEVNGFSMLPAKSGEEKDVMLALTRFADVFQTAFEECAPHKICAYIYELSNHFNRFYHANKIMSEEDKAQRESWVALLCLTLRALESSIDVLGFCAPERM
ncbi:MAG: arginine--tRNA ligase [Lachnospiraceae bacterium]